MNCLTIYMHILLKSERCEECYASEHNGQLLMRFFFYVLLRPDPEKDGTLEGRNNDIFPKS